MGKLVHYLVLGGIIFWGALLRFWQLDSKPLWLDEVVTALVSQGRGYQNLPVNVAFSLAKLQELFTFRPEISCEEIAQVLATDSTHPPLFFCLTHEWLAWLDPLQLPWVWKLRALSALIGVVAIAAVYFLTRLAFSGGAGLVAAALMAVSPFGVYLGQEARHYTLAVLFITFALIGLLKITADLDRGRSRFSLWIGWAIANSLACYVHYFCWLAFFAQIGTLAVVMYRFQRKLTRRTLTYFSLAIAIVILSYLPWWLILIQHFTSPKISWLSPPANIAPFGQIIVAWLLMFIALPVEGQTLPIQVILGLLMLGFGIWAIAQISPGYKKLSRMSKTNQATFILTCFISFVLVEIFAIVYILRKDITVAPRYNFLYYPALISLCGACLANNTSKSLRFSRQNERWFNYPTFVILLIGFFSSIFVIFNLAFQKPYHPQQIAQTMISSPNPIAVAIASQKELDLALGLSYALALQKIGASVENTSVVFFDPDNDYNSLWQKLSNLSVSPASLWLITPTLKPNDYPPTLDLAGNSSCTLEPTAYYRLDISYQRYRCLK
ncbi:MAG: glycosyltransferase family 39 protein [Oscillatoria sp. PMC 1076.18]|nr:glycosyltransferase family 39 protein [Oscillatoria sp. PMC 1076.18]